MQAADGVRFAGTATGQFPFAAFVSCIDSRESGQLIFDQGIGDIFNARVAGNFVNDDILGSLEFACAVAGAKLIVVMGHTECGAVKGACDDIVWGTSPRRYPISSPRWLPFPDMIPTDRRVTMPLSRLWLIKTWC